MSGAPFLHRLTSTWFLFIFYFHDIWLQVSYSYVSVSVLLNQNGASFPHGVADDADESVATATTPAIHDESKRPGTGEWPTEPKYV